LSEAAPIAKESAQQIAGTSFFDPAIDFRPVVPNVPPRREPLKIRREPFD